MNRGHSQTDQFISLHCPPDREWHRRYRRWLRDHSRTKRNSCSSSFFKCMCRPSVAHAPQRGGNDLKACPAHALRLADTGDRRSPTGDHADRTAVPCDLLQTRIAYAIHLCCLPDHQGETPASLFPLQPGVFGAMPWRTCGTARLSGPPQRGLRPFFNYLQAENRGRDRTQKNPRAEYAVCLTLETGTDLRCLEGPRLGPMRKSTERNTWPWCFSELISCPNNKLCMHF